jgi:hypothetical protein
MKSFNGVVRKVFYDHEYNLSSMYEGQYKNGFAQGYGRMIFSEGSLYVGNFEKN